jgi:hypothetical protein
VPTDETEVYQRVRFLKVAGTHVSLWLFPEHFSKSPVSTNIFDSTTLTSFLLGHIWLSTEERLPEDAPLNCSWFSTIVYATRIGISMANDSPDGARTLSLDELVTYLWRSRSVQINLFPPKLVRLSDPNHASRLVCQLEAMSNRTAALFTYGNKSFLFLSHDNGVLLVDSHKNGEFGASAIKGNLTKLGQYLKSLETTLGLDEQCYGNFVLFA